MRSTNRLYTGDEYQARLGIYLTNARLVQEHNAKGTFRVSLNKFAALTPSEYRTLLGFKPFPGRASLSRVASGRLGPLTGARRAQ